MQISVVIPVFDQASEIVPTLNSVLAQSENLLEIILVNDGSSNKSKTILESLANQHRIVKLLHQEHRGITQALINGCEHAQGKFIARQDIGDISKPNRFERQLQALNKNNDIVICSCGTDFMSSKGELLYTINDNSETADNGLHPIALDDLRGPSHHGATLFSRSAYESIGGYRSQFIVAQDMDLWLRLAEIGTHITTETVEYLATIRRSSISTKKRALQEATRKIIFNCYQARQAGVDDATLLDQLKRLNTQQDESQAKSDYDYFVGSMLYLKRDKAALPYLQSALRSRPYAVKAWLKLLHLRLFGS